MRRSETEKIDKVIEAVFKQMGLSQKMKEMRVINAWPTIIGQNIARSTKKMNIFNRTLFIYIDSSIVKNELLMLKSSIVIAVNKHAGENIIDEVVIR